LRGVHRITRIFDAEECSGECCFYYHCHECYGSRGGSCRNRGYAWRGGSCNCGSEVQPPTRPCTECVTCSSTGMRIACAECEEEFANRPICAVNDFMCADCSGITVQVCRVLNCTNCFLCECTREENPPVPDCNADCEHCVVDICAVCNQPWGGGCPVAARSWLGMCDCRRAQIENACLCGIENCPRPWHSEWLCYVRDCAVCMMIQLCQCGGQAGGFCDCDNPCPRDFCGN
jgi:hypothetical protein